MQFEKGNQVVQYIVEGYNLQKAGDKERASAMFSLAWRTAKSVPERFLSGHFVARYQPTRIALLNWNMEVVKIAQKMDPDMMYYHFPSLFMNVGRCREDHGNYTGAIESYQLALQHRKRLKKDDYGKMILEMIHEGLERSRHLEDITPKKIEFDHWGMF
jgi:tetratricopeptide (TPR) repeat protein